MTNLTVFLGAHSPWVPSDTLSQKPRVFPALYLTSHNPMRRWNAGIIQPNSGNYSIPLPESCPSPINYVSCWCKMLPRRWNDAAVPQVTRPWLTVITFPAWYKTQGWMLIRSGQGDTGGNMWGLKTRRNLNSLKPIKKKKKWNHKLEFGNSSCEERTLWGGAWRGLKAFLTGGWEHPAFPAT